jgi:hypothetical protein
VNKNIVYDLPAHGDAVVVAAGPLTRQPATVAHRVTIRHKREGQATAWVVSNQFFPLYPRLDKFHFGDGHYVYGEDKLPDAIVAFAKVLTRHAENVKSLFRQEVEGGGENLGRVAERLAQEAFELRPHQDAGGEVRGQPGRGVAADVADPPVVVADGQAPETPAR